MITQEMGTTSRPGELLIASSADVDAFRTKLRMFRRDEISRRERSASAPTFRRVFRWMARRANRIMGRPWLMYLAVATGVTGVCRYGGAISAKHGVSKRDQFLRLSIDYYLNHTPIETFYVYQFYLPERWKSRSRHFPDAGLAQDWLLAKLASPDLELLANKDKFAVACEKRNLPTIPVIAEFLFGSPKSAFVELPSADLFSKPASSCLGRGARSWRYDPASDRFTGGSSAGLTKQAVTAALSEQSKSLKTKIIVQRTARNHPDMASITNGALATIRIVTCRAPSGAIDILPPVIKMPAGPTVVDNLLGGGVAAPLDRNNGTIIGHGIQRDLATVLKRWTVHPDTGVPLLGFSVPGWSEVVKLALRAHQSFSGLHFVGWDIAVLQSGPVLVEGNALWEATLIVLPHGISLSDTQFVPYFNYHADRLLRR